MDITKQQLLADTFMVGIDPAKKRHQAVRIACPPSFWRACLFVVHKFIKCRCAASRSLYFY